MFEDIRNIKSGKKELREFGLTIGIILVILGVVALWRNKGAIIFYLFGAGSLFILAGLALPRVLRPLQRIWMSFSIVIGFFVSRLILTILFFGVITPMGFISRLFGKDVLDERIDRTRESYWLDKEIKEESKESYENQY